MATLDEWKAASPAIWVERSGSQVLSLRHPTYPAETTWNGAPNALLGIGATYLNKVRGLFGLPELFKPNASEFKVPLAWLTPSNRLETPHPREWVSFGRYKNPLARNRVPIDRTIVLVATETTAAGKDKVYGSRRGISITMHLHRRSSNARWQVRITSATCSQGLPDELEARRNESAAIRAFQEGLLGFDILLKVKTMIREQLGLDEDVTISIDGVRPRVPGALIEFYATSTPPAYRREELPYAMRVRFAFAGKLPLTVKQLERHPLITHAASPVKANMFARDPASKAGLGSLIDSRPNRSSDRLWDYVDQNVLLNGIHKTNGLAKLDDSEELLRVVVDSEDPITVRVNDGRKVRSTAFSGLSAYGHGRGDFDDHQLRSLFDTVIAYGLWPYGYFRFANYPLLVRDRARIRPGPGKDGKTVNAQVKLMPPEVDLIGDPEDWDRSLLRWLEVRFALADVKRTTVRRDRLGLSTDARWSWHEYCHVLLAGQTSKLEFSFAHSAGDALAAILADPLSKLADASPYMRGYTFPWVYIHRRHDRQASQGWAWCGRYHRPNRFLHPNTNTRHKGYDSEQILSSSLFRLYLALGGDTAGNDAASQRARQRAADYVAYMILRAIRQLPPHSFSVLETPDQLVAKLIDADIATWPVASGPLRNRSGGWAHKVVRWAFEAQGLYATTNPADVIDGPGLPPPTDIFIDNLRPDSEGPFTRGGYMPVPLDWQGTPYWHADPQTAVMIDNQNRVRVQVRNRGNLPASGVSVVVWYKRWPNAQANPPDWDRKKWNSLILPGSRTVRPWPDPGVTFGPFQLPGAPGTRLLVLAVSDCPADPANTEKTALHCANTSLPVIDLVAGDNNLGLVVHRLT
jgi:hypothetical protein